MWPDFQTAEIQNLQGGRAIEAVLAEVVQRWAAATLPSVLSQIGDPTSELPPRPDEFLSTTSLAAWDALYDEWMTPALEMLWALHFIESVSVLLLPASLQASGKKDPPIQPQDFPFPPPPIDPTERIRDRVKPRTQEEIDALLAEDRIAARAAEQYNVNIAAHVNKFLKVPDHLPTEADVARGEVGGPRNPIMDLYWRGFFGPQHTPWPSTHVPPPPPKYADPVTETFARALRLDPGLVRDAALTVWKMDWPQREMQKHISSFKLSTTVPGRLRDLMVGELTGRGTTRQKELTTDMVSHWTKLFSRPAEVMYAPSLADLPTIAMSQASGVINNALYTAIDKWSDPEEPLDKIWVAHIDKRTRPTHFAADGQRVGFDAKFLVGGHDMAYPGDSGAPASETRRCRCRFGVVKGDDPTPKGGKRSRAQTQEIAARRKQGIVRASEDPAGVGYVHDTAPSLVEVPPTKRARTKRDAPSAFTGTAPVTESLARDLDPRAAASIERAYADFHKKYPAVPLGAITDTKVFPFTAETETFAVHTAHGPLGTYEAISKIHMDPSLKDYDAVVKGWEKAVKDGLHPPAGPDGDAYRAIITHELGHVLADQKAFLLGGTDNLALARGRNILADQALKMLMDLKAADPLGSTMSFNEWISKNVSSYAGRNINEGLASGFQDAELNGELARPVSKAIHKFLTTPSDGAGNVPATEIPSARELVAIVRQRPPVADLTDRSAPPGPTEWEGRPSKKERADALTARVPEMVTNRLERFAEIPDDVKRAGRRWYADQMTTVANQALDTAYTPLQAVGVNVATSVRTLYAPNLAYSDAYLHAPAGQGEAVIHAMGAMTTNAERATRAVRAQTYDQLVAALKERSEADKLSNYLPSIWSKAHPKDTGPGPFFTVDTWDARVADHSPSQIRRALGLDPDARLSDKKEALGERLLNERLHGTHWKWSTKKGKWEELPNYVAGSMVKDNYAALKESGVRAARAAEPFAGTYESRLNPATGRYETVEISGKPTPWSPEDFQAALWIWIRNGNSS